MADEAVTPAGERAERRRHVGGLVEEWVRAVDAGDDARARWIEDEEPVRPPRSPRPRADREPGTEPPVA
jgi:hypothetical protein